MNELTLSFSHAHQMFDFDRIDKALDRGERDKAYNFMLDDLEKMKKLITHLKYNNFEILFIDSTGLNFRLRTELSLEDIRLPTRG